MALIDVVIAIFRTVRLLNTLHFMVKISIKNLHLTKCNTSRMMTLNIQRSTKHFSH